jgi:thiamine-phosphate diphosphorylase
MTAEPRARFSEGSGLYLVLTEPAVPHAELAAEAVRLSVPVIQLREKRLGDEALAAIARSLRDATRDTSTLLIINDRADLAAAVGADGVHVGPGDLSAAAARAVVGPRTLVGVSARSPEEIEAARRAGADYVGVGPVFPTATKPDALPPVGIRGLREAAAAAEPLPVVAIGGIDRDTAAGVLAAGARYVAVISAVCHAPDPIAALEAFVSSIRTSGSHAREGGKDT